MYFDLKEHDPMRLNYRLIMILALLFYGFLCLTTASAEEKNTADVSGKLKYDFSEIKVLYAAEFVAYPQESTLKADSVIGSVYGESQPIHVLYGVVSLGTGGEMKEEFIRVDEGSSFTRGLSNSFSWDNYGAKDYEDKIISTEFVTGKTLEGNSVVKDYSEGWKTIKLTRTIDEIGNMKDISIHFNWDLIGTPDPFFEKLAGTVYKVDISSLKHVGQQEVGP
jgi:hypothetical protein